MKRRLKLFGKAASDAFKPPEIPNPERLISPKRFDAVGKRFASMLKPPKKKRK